MWPIPGLRTRSKLPMHNHSYGNFTGLCSLALSFPGSLSCEIRSRFRMLERLKQGSPLMEQGGSARGTLWPLSYKIWNTYELWIWSWSPFTSFACIKYILLSRSVYPIGFLWSSDKMSRRGNGHGSLKGTICRSRYNRWWNQGPLRTADA